MDPVKVPQNLELTDVLIWGMGPVDLLIAAVGGIAAWWAYLLLPGPFWLRVAAAVLLAGLGALIALGRAGDQSLRGWLAILFAYLRRPRHHAYGGNQ